MLDAHHSSADDHLVIPPFGDPNQALFNGTGNLSPEVADSSQVISPAQRQSSDNADS